MNNQSDVTATHKTSGLSQLLTYVVHEEPEKDLLVNTDRTGVIRYVFLQLLPRISSFLLVLPALRIYQKIKSYVKEPNKNLDNTLDMLISLLMSGTSITLTVIVALGLTYLAPYLLIAGLSVATVGGIYGTLKNISLAYTAHQEKDITQRNKFIFDIPRALLLACLSSLGMLAHLSWMFNFSEIASAFSAGWAAFNNVKDIFIVIGCAITLSTIPSMMKKIIDLNSHTLENLAHPLQTVKSMANDLRAVFQKAIKFARHKPLTALIYTLPALTIVTFEAARALVGLASRVIALAILPLQLIATAVKTNVIDPAKKNLLHEKNSHAGDLTKESTALVGKVFQQKISHLQQELKKTCRTHRQLKIQLTAKIALLKATPASPKRNAKLFLANQLLNKLGRNVKSYNVKTSLAEMEQQAKTISPRLYQSFWTLNKGEMETIAGKVKNMDTTLEAINGLRSQGFFMTKGKGHKFTATPKNTNVFEPVKLIA